MNYHRVAKRLSVYPKRFIIVIVKFEGLRIIVSLSRVWLVRAKWDYKGFGQGLVLMLMVFRG